MAEHHDPSPSDLALDLAAEADLSDAERQGYATGNEELRGSTGSSHQIEADVPEGGNPATTLDES